MLSNIAFYLLYARPNCYHQPGSPDRMVERSGSLCTRINTNNLFLSEWLADILSNSNQLHLLYKKIR